MFNNFKQDRTSKSWLKRHPVTSVLGLVLICAFLPATAFAQNNSTDPDATSETPDYISINLSQDIVAVGDSFSGTATIDYGDGSIDTDDSLTVSPSSQTGNGVVSYTVPASSPGDVTIDASSSDASPQSTVGHAVAVNAILTPADNFAGRSQTSYGVGESINLSFTTTPEGYESKIGTPQWSSSNGITNDYGNGTGTFFAGDAAGSANITLSITSGALKGKSYTKSRAIVAPSGITYVQTGGVIHTYGQASAGFYALMYLTPTNVSFDNVQEEEEYTKAEEDSGKKGPVGVGTGSLSPKNGAVHVGGGYDSVGSGNIKMGCQVDATDNVIAENGAGPFATSGDFTWDIPRDYKVGSTGTVHSAYTTIVHHNHQSATDAKGNSITTMTKAGISVSANQNDPTSP